MKDSIQLLPCPEHALTLPHSLVGSGGSPPADRDTCRADHVRTAACDSGLDPNSNVVGVSHVGFLRAGAARQVVAALADGQLLVYRENGEHIPS